MTVYAITDTKKENRDCAYLFAEDNNNKKFYSLFLHFFTFRIFHIPHFTLRSAVLFRMPNSAFYTFAIFRIPHFTGARDTQHAGKEIMTRPMSEYFANDHECHDLLSCALRESAGECTVNLARSRRHT